MNINLNDCIVESDGNFPEVVFIDNSTNVSNADISAVFRNQKEILLKKISEYNCIISCVAWLTDFEIIDALSKVDRVSIIVQKEDFLRPDLNSEINWKKDFAGLMKN